MSTDLVSRLRAKAAKGGVIPIHDVTIAEAADQIEHLSRHLRDARQLLEDWMIADHTFDLEGWAKKVRDMLEDSNPFNENNDE